MILVDTDSTTGGKAMAVRLVVTFQAASGKGAELAQAMKARCEVSRQDAGCEQFEVFQSVSDPDKLVSEPVLGVLVSIGINPPSAGLEAGRRVEEALERN